MTDPHELKSYNPTKHFPDLDTKNLGARQTRHLPLGFCRMKDAFLRSVGDEVGTWESTVARPPFAKGMRLIMH